MALLRISWARFTFVFLSLFLLLPASILHADNSQIPVHVKRALAQGDIKTGLSWLNQAADQNNGLAALKLANIYRLGKLVDKDLDKSERYLSIAAKQGIAEGQYLLGLHYAHLGDSTNAIHWFDAASTQNHERAKAERARIAITTPQSNIFRLIESVPSSSGPYQSVNVNTVDETGRTPLIFAIQKKKRDWITHLLRGIQQEQLDKRDSLGNTALHYAVESEQLVVVKQLLESQTDVSSTNSDGATALHLAVAGGNTDIIRSLFSQGARLDIADNSGWTPAALIERSSNPKLNQFRQPSQLNRRQVRSQTCDTQKFFSAARRNSIAIMRDCLKQGAPIDLPDQEGYTALTLAAELGHFDLVEVLLDEGADPKVENPKGQNLLSQVVRATNIQLTRRLAKPQSGLDHTDQKGHNALHHAILAQCEECAATLINAGTTTHLVANDGNATIILAVKSGLIGAVEKLLRAGAPVNTADSNGRTSLWWASQRKRLQIADLLVSAGATFKSDNDGVSPLHIAVEFNNPALLDIVVTKASTNDLNSPTHNGNTPLITAAYHDNSLGVRRLIDKGVNVDTPRPNGDTALIVAVRRGSINAARALIELGASLNRRNDQRQSAMTLIEALDDPAWQSLADQAPSELESLLNKFTQR